MSKRKKSKDPYYKREAAKYANPIPSREYIMTVLDQEGRALMREELELKLGIDDEEHMEALRRRLIAMLRDGQLIKNRRGKYALVEKLELVLGTVIGHKEGYGFLESNLNEDIFLPAYQMRQVFSGDKVLVRITEKRRGRLEGIIVEILERNTLQIAGRFFKENGLAFVEPDNKTIAQDIVVPKGNEGGAKASNFVVAEIITWPNTRRQATGKIIEILGDALTPGMEIELAIRAHHLPHVFSDTVKEEIAGLKETVKTVDKERRKDLRSLPLVTIDGEDAKDFDDAVYCETMPNGGWRLYVAIADVSHYVTSKTALDEEAYLRGNSVYFPSRVIPMLPHILSSGLCSLKPNVDRLCVCAEIHIDKDGNLSRYRFYDAVMRSHARLTYTEMAKILERKSRAKMALHPHLFELHHLFKQLQKQRRRRGSLEFNTTETKILFGKIKKIKKIIPLVRNDAHKIIEECMLIANVCAAKFLHNNKIPALYRIHETPTAAKIERLRDFLKGVGLRLSGREEPGTKDFARLLERTKGRPDAHVIQMVVLRSLMQAIYNPKLGGHFGLAYKYYTHFTSPIRRYPDLLVHRAIKHLLIAKKIKKFTYNQEDMEKLGEHCSMTERRANDATYSAIDWLKCYYMQNKIGKKYEGVISGVTSFGVFVELKEIYVEGLVHITALKNDYYQYEAARHRLIGKRTGMKYCLGDQIRVIVARVDLGGRELDFEVV